MDFWISTAQAQGAAPAGGGMIEFMIMIVLFFAIMYFLIIRPQSKRAKEHKAMVDALSRGDEIVTNGGLLGRVTEVGENFMHVELADKVIVRVQRQSVSAVMPKGTMKDL